MHLYSESEHVADVVSACFSYALDRFVGLALFPASIAYSGLRFALGSPDGPPVDTISMPPIMPKSLTVKIDEM
jgi:glycine cleavage system aminomethyltransferase T